MKKIKNLKQYNTSMTKSLDDKLFFLEYMQDTDWFEDFGCADGAVLKAVNEHFPDLNLMGVDMNEDMLAQCRSRFGECERLYLKQSVVPTSSERLWNGHDNVALNLGSVLHEVYSYGTPQCIDAFWRSILSDGFQYVFVRDMTFGKNQYDPVDGDTISAIRKNKAYSDLLRSFEQIWGPIETVKDLNHFLLKYRYKENWEREVREQYLWFTPEEIVERFSARYECVYMENYVLPYHAYRVGQDFGLKVPGNTHFKAVFRRK